MSELASGPAIQSGRAEGLLEFIDWVPKNGYGTDTAWGPRKSAARQVLSTMEGDDYLDVDIRGLDLDDYMSRYETKARGQMKAESIQTYRQRFTSAVEGYRQFLDTGQPPRTASRRANRSDGEQPTRNRTRAAKSPRVASQEVVAPAPANAGDRLIDYPFPLRSGQIALLRLPVRIEKADAERLAGFVRTLVLEPQGELMRGGDTEPAV